MDLGVAGYSSQISANMQGKHISSIMVRASTRVCILSEAKMSSSWQTSPSITVQPYVLTTATDMTVSWSLLTRAHKYLSRILPVDFYSWEDFHDTPIVKTLCSFAFCPGALPLPRSATTLHQISFTNRLTHRRFDSGIHTPIKAHNGPWRRVAIGVASLVVLGGIAMPVSYMSLCDVAVLRDGPATTEEAPGRGEDTSVSTHRLQCVGASRLHEPRTTSVARSHEIVVEEGDEVNCDWRYKTDLSKALVESWIENAKDEQVLRDEELSRLHPLDPEKRLFQ